MQLKSSSYTGNATDGTGITGVGFQPDVVWIHGASGSTQKPVMCTASMGANATKPLYQGAVTFAGGVKSLDADGFTLGTDARVNGNTITYYYVAVKANAATDFKSGTYTGDGTNNRGITGVGFQPNYVLVMSAGADDPFWKSSDMTTTHSFSFAGFDSAASVLTALQADGFQVQSASNTNGNGQTYYYIAFKNATNFFKVLTYTGDGSGSPRGITGAGFQPQNLIDQSSGGDALGKYSAEAANSALGYNGTAQLTGRLDSFDADGFTTSGSSSFNTNAVAYYTALFRDGTSSAAPVMPKVPVFVAHQAIMRASNR